MKSLPHSFMALALILGSSPLVLADDAVQNGIPGAQGTEGTNPTHQDSNVTGPNGNHAGDTNPANTPALAHHKKHHHTTSASSAASSQ